MEEKWFSRVLASVTGLVGFAAAAVALWAPGIASACTVAWSECISDCVNCASTCSGGAESHCQSGCNGSAGALRELTCGWSLLCGWGSDTDYNCHCSYYCV